jgi:hypothetical protein
VGPNANLVLLGGKKFISHVPVDCLHMRPPDGSVSIVSIQGTYRNAWSRGIAVQSSSRDSACYLASISGFLLHDARPTVELF